MNQLTIPNIPAMSIADVEDDEAYRSNNSDARDCPHTDKQWYRDGSKDSPDYCSILRNLPTCKSSHIKHGIQHKRQS